MVQWWVRLSRTSFLMSTDNQPQSPLLHVYMYMYNCAIQYSSVMYMYTCIYCTFTFNDLKFSNSKNSAIKIAKFITHNKVYTRIIICENFCE